MRRKEYEDYEEIETGDDEIFTLEEITNILEFVKQGTKQYIKNNLFYIRKNKEWITLKLPKEYIIAIERVFHNYVEDIILTFNSFENDTDT